MENYKESDFIRKARETGRKMSKEITPDNGRGFIYICIDNEEEPGGRRGCLIGFDGRGDALVSGLVDFATRKETKPFFMAALSHIIENQEDFLKNK